MALWVRAHSTSHSSESKLLVMYLGKYDILACINTESESVKIYAGLNLKAVIINELNN